ncbi:MAG TPA: hypothetical protein VFY29_08850, partial [Terriglobia bacterium]|nr:hypothetical protein [Terriglobia bacterium]
LVALVPSLARRQNVTLYRTTTSDEFGAFAISGVAPGEYRVFAWETVPEHAWMNPDFMALEESHGRSVVVGASGLDDVNLKLIPR